MNKEIKFRQAIFHSETKKFMKWHYWGFVNNIFISPIVSGIDIDKVMNDSYQFTGLPDKNGKEIYEGNIVRINDEPIENVSTVEDITNIGWLKGFIGRSRPVEIIGSEFENPELLEEK